MVVLRLAALALVLRLPVETAAAPKKPMHFVVALVDDLGGYNVPWRNPEQRYSFSPRLALLPHWHPPAPLRVHYLSMVCQLLLSEQDGGRPVAARDTGGDAPRALLHVQVRSPHNIALTTHQLCIGVLYCLAC